MSRDSIPCGDVVVPRCICSSLVVQTVPFKLAMANYLRYGKTRRRLDLSSLVSFADGGKVVLPDSF